MRVLLYNGKDAPGLARCLNDLIKLCVKAGSGGSSDGEHMIMETGVRVIAHQRPWLGKRRLRVIQKCGGDLCLHNLARGHLHRDPEVRRGRPRGRVWLGDEGGQRGQGDGGGRQRHRDRGLGVQIQAEKIKLVKRSTIRVVETTNTQNETITGVNILLRS